MNRISSPETFIMQLEKGWNRIKSVGKLPQELTRPDLHFPCFFGGHKFHDPPNPVYWRHGFDPKATAFQWVQASKRISRHGFCVVWSLSPKKRIYIYIYLKLHFVSGKYHLEGRWRYKPAMYALVYYGPLQIATCWEWRSPSTFTTVHFVLQIYVTFALHFWQDHPIALPVVAPQWCNPCRRVTSSSYPPLPQGVIITKPAPPPSFGWSQLVVNNPLWTIWNSG